MRHAVRYAKRYENGTPANRRPLAALYTIPAILFMFVGLLAAVVVAVVGLGRAIEWVGIYLPVVVLGVFVGVFVLFVREGGKVYAKFYDELYKRL